MTLRNRGAALLAILALTGAGAASAGCGVGVIANLKLTMAGTSPLISARINGQDVSMIADSGAFYSTLGEGVVIQYKLPRRLGNPYMYSVGIGGTESINLATVKTFTLAGHDFANVVFTVSNNDLGGGVAGVMGQNLLGYADADYDLANGSIRLIKTSGCGDKPFVVWEASKPTSIMPMKVNEGPFKEIAGEAEVNGHRIRVIFDTGASTSILSLDAAKRAGISVNDAGVVTGGVERGFGRGMVQSWIAPVASFKIGDEQILHTRLRIARMALPETDMLLGADFFLSHRIFVANSQNRIYFTYNGGPVFNLDAAPQPAKPLAEPAAASGGVEKAAETADADSLSRRGAAHAGRREYGAAIADLTRAIAIDPKQEPYLRERAGAYLGDGRAELAMADLDHALVLKPDDSEALLTRARLNLMRSDMTAATADLARTDSLLPPASDQRLTMAMMYEAAPAATSAIAQYDLWIKAHPDDNRLPMALNSRCWLRALWNIAPEKALVDCDLAVRANRKSATFLDSRGLAHLRLGQNDKAIADYDAALALNPQIAWSRFGRGVARLRLGQAAEGQADLAAAAALRPALAAEAKTHGLDK